MPKKGKKVISETKLNAYKNYIWNWIQKKDVYKLAPAREKKCMDLGSTNCIKVRITMFC